MTNKDKKGDQMQFLESEIRPFSFPVAPAIKEKTDVSLVEELASRIDQNIFNRSGDFPKVSDSQIKAMTVQRVVAPLRSQPSEKFGSQWNKITAKAAAVSLGWNSDERHLSKLLNTDSERAIKLKERQAKISELWELNIRLKAEEKVGQLKPKVSAIVWVQERLAFASEIFLKFHNLSKSKKERISKAAIGALVDFIHKFGTQTFDRSSLLKRIISSEATGCPLTIVSLHCPPFHHSSDGINVIPSANDQQLINNEGKTVIVSQGDILEEVNEVIEIFRRNGIETKTLTVVLDIDEFVIGDQETNLASFCSSLEEIIRKKNLPIDIIRTSRLMGVLDLDDQNNEVQDIWKLWKKMAAETSTMATRLIDEEFMRLQRTSLPVSMKTRDFATQMAGRRFVVHFLMGKSLPALFPDGIVLLRARGSEASEIDKLGAKSKGKNLLIVNHWRKRKISS